MQTADQGDYQARSVDEAMASNASGVTAKRKPVARKSKAPDPALPEKKRARRRLIGAVALALAAAIGLPLIFDSEPKINVDAIDIQIPSKDKALSADAANASIGANAGGSEQAARRTKPLPDEVDPAEEVIPASALSEAAKTEVEKKAAEPQIKPSEVAPTADNQTHTASSKPAPDSASKLNAKPESKPEPKLDNKHADPKSIAKVDSKPESKSEAKPTNKSDINDAETARALAILEGRPVAKAANTEKTEKSEKAEKFSVQVAALATQEKVDELRARLNGAGFQTYTQKVATSSGDKIRVRVGPFASKDEAEKARNKLVKMGLNGSLIPQ